MADTMTLEALRTYLADMETEDVVVINAALDAAIRERDELRKIERIVRCEMIPDVVRWHERAEKAEAELAALKARIFHGIVLDVDDLARGHAGLPSEWRGKRVRLVVEDDDV